MPDYDVIIVGGGPAGLTAAIYLTRFRRTVAVVDDGNSRALWIPCSHNHAGFPDGVAGKQLLADMGEQARQFGAAFIAGRATAITHDGLFTIEVGANRLRSRAVLLATGVVNRRPPVDDTIHARALTAGLLRYCPICDGYEARDTRIAVLGGDTHGVSEALFLRTYSDRVTLLTLDRCELDADDRRNLDEAGIAIEAAPVRSFEFGEAEVRLDFGADAQALSFDTLYPALGSDSNLDLAQALQLDVSDCRCIVTDKEQRTSHPSVYAAGDIVEGLDQISVAMGQAAVAATSLHNDLREHDGETN